MDDLSAVVFDTAERLLGALHHGAGRWEDMTSAGQGRGWATIEEAGLPLALTAEEHGGLGLPLADGLELVQIAGRSPVPWPVVETMLANRFAAEDGRTLHEGPVTALGLLTADQRAFAALARAKQMAGALDAILSMTVAHVQERSQFGRPLAGFQAVQHQLAVLGGEVAAGRAAADHAIARIAEGATGDAATLPIGVARVRVGEAASRAAAIAHQLHGAIGYTREHRLHRYTTALWAWRDQFGTQTYWSRAVGRLVLARDAGDLWPMVTAA
ncbi:hypothetical protein GRI40_12395 [Altererythrobacter aerius]|uniref:Acyl-CoA dehydrogenase/oxidase C-terminal domain-containing protein n=1 Tax=Tsuneonella aeria TaxID=1837929 RepID=A0A6I4TH70_9SPHN|nr:acyl-CoA dehydrogenase family protein [Tsuneonella aeria]MXO76016.1 hypothetical protein [Tsuneonella aeria]